MYTCDFNGPKTARWVFRIDQATPGITFGNPLVDSTLSYFGGTGTAFGPFEPTRTELRASTYLTFNAWVQGSHAALFAGLHLDAWFNNAVLGRELRQVGATAWEVDWLFDLDKLLAAYPQACELGLKMVINPNPAQVAALGGSGVPDNYVRIRNLLGPSGVEQPTSGAGAWPITCCDPPPEEPTDPVRVIADCLTVPAFSCMKSAEGINEVWIAWHDALVSAPLDPTQRVKDLIFAQGAGLHKLGSPVQGGAYSETLEMDGEGTRFNQSLTVVIPHRTSEHRDTINRLRRGRWAVVFEDRNGRMWLLGRNPKCPMRVITHASTTGAFASGENQYTIDLRSFDWEQAWELTPELAQRIRDNDPDVTGGPDCADLIGVPLQPYALWLLRDCYLIDFENNDLA